MDICSSVNAWLNSIGDTFGENLRLDDRGICCLKNDEYDDIDVVVELPYKEHDYLCLHSELMDIPEDKEQKRFLLVTALNLNLFQLETEGGAIFKLEAERLAYCKRFNPRELNFESFCEELSKFFTTANKLKELLTKQKKDFDEYR